MRFPMSWISGYDFFTFWKKCYCFFIQNFCENITISIILKKKRQHKLYLFITPKEWTFKIILYWPTMHITIVIIKHDPIMKENTNNNSWPYQHHYQPHLYWLNQNLYYHIPHQNHNNQISSSYPYLLPWPKQASQ